MDGVVLDDAELIELLALGDEPLLVRHGRCCLCNSGKGGGGCLSLYSNQKKCRVEQRERRLEGVWRSNAFCFVLRPLELVHWRFCRNLSQYEKPLIEATPLLRGLLLRELVYTLKTPKHPSPSSLAPQAFVSAEHKESQLAKPNHEQRHRYSRADGGRDPGVSDRGRGPGRPR